MSESALSSIIRGGLAGAAGVWALDRLQWFTYGLGLDLPRRRAEANRPDDVDPTRAAVSRVSRATRWSGGNGTLAAVATHYGPGVVPGALYALLRGRARWAGAGVGLPFGAAFFVAEDQVASTVVRTGGPPAGYHWQDRARGLVGHLLYGVVVEMVMRATDRR